MEKVKCQICGMMVNFIQVHLEKEHPLVTLVAYSTDFPDAPLCSEEATRALNAKVAEYKENPLTQYSIYDLFGFRSFGPATMATGRRRRSEHVPEVDPHYCFRQALLGVVLYGLEKFNEPVLLIGPTGSGKTSVFEQACARLNKPVTRINLDGDVTRADFVGQWVLTGENKMTFNYGPLAMAMKEGRVLIIDEIDAGAPPVTMVIQAVLEGKALTLLETGETIQPHHEFRICATANTNGQGDESGLYFGTQPQNYAMLDRFKLVDLVDYPLEDEEHAILEKRVGMKDTDGVRTRLLKVANLIRKAHKKGECSCTMSTRNVINIAEKMLVFGSVATAYKVAYLNKLSSSDLDFTNEIVQRVWAI